MRGLQTRAPLTSSVKTFTMRGITENAVRDIFEHIKNKGTIVDKPHEEIVENGEHLRHLIGIVKTIESSLRKSSGSVRAFGASLNLVDLAGSERASQTIADGERLKKGSHINRSLLTLTTVIRKLSGGKRSGHIPYRDSKLTRLLQSSLGGNARTAIICTISPALSHVEQTRNTLSSGEKC